MRKDWETAKAFNAFVEEGEKGMETIRSYIDNMFANLPRTQKVAALRLELLSNMEERYRELKAQGKSENEAIGMVISEFGDIDELLTELDIQRDANPLPEATEADVNAYLGRVRTYTPRLALGVALCILGPAMLILCNTLFAMGSGVLQVKSATLALVPMFLFIVAGVGMLIYSGMMLEANKKLESGVLIPQQIRSTLQSAMEEAHPRFVRGIITGVCLCVISPAPLFAFIAFGEGRNGWGIAALLACVAAGVYSLICSGMYQDGYEKLLKTGDFTPEKERTDKLTGTVASIIWPIAIIIFLLLGFLSNAWATAWIVFPVAALATGISSVLIKATEKK